MHRLQSQIPRLKPASSYGNLTQVAPNTPKPRSLHGSRQNLHTKETPAPDRLPMISAPTPVTHRRMFPNQYLSKPPWAIDETISPFDREPEKKKVIRNNPINRKTQSEHGAQVNHLVEPVPVRVESPSPSLYDMQDSFQRDEYDRTYSPFDNDSYYKSEIQRFVMPPPTPKQVSASQTDLTGMDLEFIQKPRSTGFRSAPSHHINKAEKRLVLPLKELKRTNQKNYPTYKVNNRPNSTQDPIDYNKVFNVQDRYTNNNDEEIQSRIDYWLNKSISLDQARQEKAANFGVKDSPTSPGTKKPIFRNQITFTPRPISHQFAENGNVQNHMSHSSNPQIIEAVIFQSDSESEKDYIVSSKSMENKLNRSNSHFTIRANLASKGKAPNKEISNTITCEVCNQPLTTEDQVNYSGITCHKNCFKCFWCKKKLSLDNYKINIDKLCCPLHFRLLSN